jgi:hypothetical protein
LPPVLLYGVTLQPGESIKGFKVNRMRGISLCKGIQSIREKFGCRSRLGEVRAVFLIKQRQGGSRLETRSISGKLGATG